MKTEERDWLQQVLLPWQTDITTLSKSNHFWVQHHTYPYQVASISDEQFLSFCTHTHTECKNVM